MSLKISPINMSLTDSCVDFERMCFWDSAIYAVPENILNGNKVIGSFGPDFYKKLCPSLKIRYSLVNGKEICIQLKYVYNYK